ncbi:hypothetical protein [Sulfuriferula thiophila]|uniref:hypothetical protein n=1 Tax=Sulfuriferula thiophila TaxID=1781211 RepID=UPI000F60F3E1|nr:hypothetical protein [Sulfuriferula thiophila]
MSQTQQEISMLRNELEMLMRERDGLLRVSGAAAVFVAELDSEKLPAVTLEAAEMLAESLNELTEDTLQDALNAVKAHIQVA